MLRFFASRPHTARGRLWRIVAAVVLIGAAFAVRSVSATSAHAATEPQVVPGRGIWIAGHTDFVGYYRAYVSGHWVKVYCVRPGKSAPVTLALHTVSRLAGVSRTITREIAQTLWAHGNAQTATAAEAVSQAVNEEMGNTRAVARRARYLSQHVTTLADRYVAEARRALGPYRLTLRLPDSPLPGQTGNGSVLLRSAVAGRPVAVTLRHTANVVTPALVHTDRYGHAGFRYRTVGGGAVHVAAHAVTPPITVRANRPTSTTQLMVTWSPHAAASANATYQAHGPRFTHRYRCSTACDGHPLVTLTACAPPNTYPSRITYWYDGHSHAIDYAAANSSVCKSWDVRLADGVSVSATWRYRAPSGWTAPLPAAGWFTVDCPPVPPVAVTLEYDCTHAAVEVTLGTQRAGGLVPLQNSTRHAMTLVLTGAVSGRYAVAPGQTASVHSFPLTCGVDSSLTVQAGVQRDSGAYNYGQRAVLALP